jgi:hypothetical protein
VSRLSSVSSVSSLVGFVSRLSSLVGLVRNFSPQIDFFTARTKSWLLCFHD